MANDPAKEMNRQIELLKFAAKSLSKPTTIKLLAEQATRDIKIRTRLGFGTSSESPGGNKVKLEKLSKSYRDFRKGLAAFYTDEQGRLRKFKPKNPPALSSATSPTKSNLTLSGQMIDSIDYSIKGTTIEIAARGRDNKDKVFYAHEGSKNRPKRTFLSLTNKEIVKLDQLLDRIFDLILKRIGGR